jgi:hypothetical protein
MTGKAWFFYTVEEERREKGDVFSYRSLYRSGPAQPAKAVRRTACLAFPRLHLRLFLLIVFFYVGGRMTSTGLSRVSISYIAGEEKEQTTIAQFSGSIVSNMP